MTEQSSDDQFLLAQRVKGLEAQVAAIYRALICLLLFLAVFGLIADLSVQLRMPDFSKVFAEMLSGEPLPALTSFVIQTREIGIALGLVLFLSVVALAVLRRWTVFLSYGTAVALFLVAKATVTGVALRLPLVRPVEMLGA
jgi:hypothetical protein